MGRTSANFQKLLDKATSKLQLEPDWPSIIQICDLIRQGDVKADAALAAIKKKIIQDNPHTALYGLLVLESCVKNCGSLIHDEVATKQYMEQLKEIAKTYPSEEVKLKILELIQAWAYAFRNIPKYRAVQDTVNIMKAEGCKFPELQESDAMFSADTAPEWADGNECHRCRIAFSIVHRKHHCRACGQVFCSQCSSKQCTLPKFGFEKEVRVCEACYLQVNKPSTVQTKETDLPAEYLNSSLAQQQQVPPRKTEEELREEEELNLALALSQSEAEQKEKEKKRATNAFKISSSTPVSRTTYSPPPSPGPSPSRVQDEDETEPELAKYLDRKYWEQRQSVLEEHGSRVDVTSPSAPNISSPMPQQVVLSKQQNGEVDNQLEAFVHALRTQVEIFVNRMKSNSSRGRSIANDTSVQTLFTNITSMHSRLLKYIQEQDDNRVYCEGLQDKLVTIKDQRAALNALRDEHREKLKRQAEEAERQRQLQMQHKLEIMRKQKQEYLKYQQEVALLKVKLQEREMQMRQEQLKQQYMMDGYQSAGYMGTSQGSPIRHIPYQNPATTYNPLSPTSQGVYMYGQQHSLTQYPMQTYNMPNMNSLPGYVMGHMGKQQEQPPTDPVLQARESMARVSISGPSMQMTQMNPMPQMQQPAGHQVQAHGQPIPPGHMMMSQVPPGHMPQMHGPPNQMPGPTGPISGPPSSIQRPPNPIQGLPSQMPPPSGPSDQINMSQIPQGHMGPQMHPPPQIGVSPVTHSIPGQVGLPPQIEQPGPPIPGQMAPQGLPGSIPMMNQGPTMSLPVAPPSNDVPPHQKEESKPETGELISFD